VGVGVRNHIRRLAFPLDQFAHSHRWFELAFWWFPFCDFIEVECGWGPDCVGWKDSRWYRFFRWLLGPEEPGELVYMAPRLADDPEFAEMYARWKAGEKVTFR
jgi:hypothetical protein